MRDAIDHAHLIRLGAEIRRLRKQRGWGTPFLARRAGLVQSQVVRLELGQIDRPNMTHFRALADALEVDVAEVMANASYPVPPSALTPALYLRSKYRDLDQQQLGHLTEEVTQLLRRHALDSGEGPQPGEDETGDVDAGDHP